jgi:hypothetical protein
LDFGFTPIINPQENIMSLMLINPRKRGGGRKRRSAAQVAATRRLVAHNKARHSNPIAKRRTKRRHNPVGLSRVRHVASRAVHHVRRKRRHNPIGLTSGGIAGLLMGALKGAAGSIAVNAITNFMPAQTKSGKVLYVTRAAIAILLGTVGRKVLGQNARVMAEGALVVNFTDMINTMSAGKIPGSQLHGMGGEYLSEYLNGTHMPQQLPYASSGTPGYPAHLDRELQGVGEYTM